ncbi:MAG: phosphomethylpyrimidine synthase ThiC, partial [Gammaproteobacteria bacterium]
MSAIPDEFIQRAAQVLEDAVRPFPNSRKVYVAGSRPDLRVPMREVSQSATPADFGAEPNPAITVYDTSGPYTDPEVVIDLRRGLEAVRAPWLRERGDTEALTGPSSEYGRRRSVDPKLASFRFEHLRVPRRARTSANVTQMHYAKRGLITPEMEFIAIRENQRSEELRDSALARQHPGQGFGARIPP